jgi:hypothetical protein
VVQQVEGIGDIYTRLAAFLVFFNERREDIELIALLRSGSSTPEFFNLPESRGVILIVSNGMNFHAQ